MITSFSVVWMLVINITCHRNHCYYNHNFMNDMCEHYSNEASQDMASIYMLLWFSESLNHREKYLPNISCFTSNDIWHILTCAQTQLQRYVLYYFRSMNQNVCLMIWWMLILLHNRVRDWVSFTSPCMIAAFSSNLK